MPNSTFLKTNIAKACITIFTAFCLSVLFLSINPAPAKAAFPGYNGKIVFVSTRDGNDEIYEMNPDGSNQTRITNNPASDKDPAWSPDGSTIAFTSNRDGNNEIYVMNADGSNQTRLTTDTAIDGAPRWSPDGTWIVFKSMRDGNYEVYKMHAGGTDQTRLTNDPGIDSDPKYLSNGSKIIFTSNRTGTTQIYSMNTDGTNLIQITHYVTSATVPAPAPDDTTLVYTDARISGNPELYQINLDGSSPIRLTNNSDNDNTGIYSPNGKQIVFLRISSGINYIYTMNADGTQQTALTSLSADGRAPDWQTIPNKVPVANPDTITVPFNTAGSIALLSNDTDEETLSTHNLTISIQPTHGTVSVDTITGQITYIPAAGYIGLDQLTYQICDSFILDQKCSTAVLDITVQASTLHPSVTLSSIGSLKTVTGVQTYYYTGHRPTFSGTATPGATIKVEIHSDPIILITTTNSSGNWSVTPTQDIPNGDHTITITATKDGASTSLANYALGINTGLAETGAPIWPIGLIGLTGVIAGRWYLRRLKLRE